MDVKNAVLPNEAQLAAFGDADADMPIYMVNLLKFKERAAYADGRESSLTGREAYAIYGKAMAKLLIRFGGELIFAGDVTHLTIGEVEELWDEVAIAMYPSRQAMLEAATCPEFQEIMPHRMAGLAGQLNIETTRSELTDGIVS